MVSSARTWYSAMCWLSPTCGVSPLRARGRRPGRRDNTHGSRLYVTEIRDGRVTLSCQFDVEDEEQAFAYAEERCGRPPVDWRSRTGPASRCTHMANARCVPTTSTAHSVHLSEGYRIRRPSTTQRRSHSRASRVASRSRANPCSVQPLRMAHLAVRGERLSLSSSRWSDDAGNETTHLHVFEIGDDGLIHTKAASTRTTSGAYRELDRRYYAGEGAAFAEAGSIGNRIHDRHVERRLRQVVRRTQPPRHACRESIAVRLSGSLDCRTPRQHRGAGRHGRLGPDVALRRVSGCRRRAASAAMSAKPSGTTANDSHGRDSGRSRSATAASPRCARSNSRTRRRRSRTPRNGCGRPQPAAGHQPGNRGGVPD